jgi:heat shock protein HslJ
MKTLTVFFITLNSIAFGQTKPFGDYKLISIKDIASKYIDTTYRHEKGVTAIFNPDSILIGKLTVNSYWASFYVDRDKMKIRTKGYTKICCDNKLSQQFYKRLGETESFLISKDTLILTGPENVLYLIEQK